MSDIPFEERRAIALEKAEERSREVWAKSSELEAIDKELSGIGLNIFKTALLPDDKRQAEFNRLSDQTRMLHEKKAKLLALLGYPEDYTKPKYECDKCSDSGYIGHKMCDCYRKYLMTKRARASGLGKALETQSFETIRPELYPESVRHDMMGIVDTCRKYANEFNGEDGSSLLLIGSTGLGKTHLSSAIAKTVLENGFSVVYESAQNLISTFERDRFSQETKKASDRYFDCDLLIIDDFGTEVRAQTSLSYFYTLINTRLVNSKSVIINTNLTGQTLQSHYDERFVSRLLGEYRVILFKGEDVRKIKKLRGIK